MVHQIINRLDELKGVKNLFVVVDNLPLKDVALSSHCTYMYLHPFDEDTIPVVMVSNVKDVPLYDQYMQEGVVLYSPFGIVKDKWQDVHVQAKEMGVHRIAIMDNDLKAYNVADHCRPFRDNYNAIFSALHPLNERPSTADLYLELFNENALVTVFPRQLPKDEQGFESLARLEQLASAIVISCEPDTYALDLTLTSRKFKRDEMLRKSRITPKVSAVVMGESYDIK